MNALSKILTGTVVAMTVLTVACGKKNGGGGSSGNAGVGCIQMGASCVAPGQPGFGGDFRGDIGNQSGGYTVTVRLRNASFGGGWGGGSWGPAPGQINVGYQPQVGGQAIIDLSMRPLNNVFNVGFGWGGRAITGRGIFNPNGTSTIQATDGNSYQVNVQINAQQMNIQIAGAINVAGSLFQVGGNTGWGGGGGYGGAGYGGGWGQQVISYPVSTYYGY